MVSTKWTYHKERSFVSSCFIFLKILFQFKNLKLIKSYKEFIWCTNNPNVHIRTFGNRLNLIWRYFFPASILKRVSFYYLIVRNWRSHWLVKFSIFNIAAGPSISTTGTIHARNTYLAAANIESTQKWILRKIDHLKFCRSKTFNSVILSSIIFFCFVPFSNKIWGNNFKTLGRAY